MAFHHQNSSSRSLHNAVENDSAAPGVGKDPYHGRSYHKFFEGYTEYPKTNQKGRTRIVRVYTADYHKASLSPLSYAGVRLLYFCAAIISSGLYAAALLMNVPSNYSRYVVIFEAISLVALFFFFLYLASYILAKPMMTLRKYRCAKTMRGLSKTSAILRIPAALGAVICGFLHSESLPAEMGSALFILVSAALLFSISVIEGKITYDKIPNPSKVHEPDAVLIEQLK